MLSAILPAAGRSSRMGSLKALLPWGNTTLIESQIEQVARSGIDELVVVTGFQSERLLPVIAEMEHSFRSKLNLSAVVNRQYLSGRTSSIRAGMEEISRNSKGVVILSVDQPVRSKTLDKLVCGLTETEIRIPTFQGKKGHPPLFSSYYFQQINHITEENQGLREIINSNRGKVKYIEVEEPQILLNLNREQDYIEAKENGFDRYF